MRANLSHLAVQKNVVVATQRVALRALLFLYRHVLQIDVSCLELSDLL